MRALPGWLGGRAPAVPQPDPPASFDALVAVGPYNLREGVAPGRAIIAIRQALLALPGAGWINVEHHPAGNGDRAVEVFPTGHPDPGLLRRVEAAVATAIDGLVPAAPPPAVPGFAEGPARFHAAPDACLDAAPDPFDWRDTPAPGPMALRDAGDADLLAALLARVVPEGAAAAARCAVDRFGSFPAVLAQQPAELLKLPGLGPHSVAAIKLVHAAALRLSRAAIMDQPAPTSFDGLIAYLTAALAREPLEHFRILFLDPEGRVRADEAQARGTVNHTPVYPREVVRRALELAAASVILVHNHPSGDPAPSAADIDMTATVQQACRAVGLEVQDHIIIGNGRWFSFSEAGHLAPAHAAPHRT